MLIERLMLKKEEKLSLYVQERMMLMERLMLEKEEYGTRQEEEMCRLLKKQDEESQFLARYIKPKSTICTLHAPPPFASTKI